jgi:hypothetical protein
MFRVRYREIVERRAVGDDLGLMKRLGVAGA